MGCTCLRCQTVSLLPSPSAHFCTSGRRPPSTRERPEPKRRRNIKPKPFVAEDLKLSSKRLLRKVLAMALDHAISEDRLSENVARKAKLPKTSEDNTKVPDYFTTDEARQFLVAAQDDRLYACL